MAQHTFHAVVEHENGEDVSYPTIAVTYRYSPGCRAFTYPGEFAPTDPPESAEVEFVSATLVCADGDAPAPDAAVVDKLGREYLASRAGYRDACRDAEENSGPDPDYAYESARDDAIHFPDMERDMDDY